MKSHYDYIVCGTGPAGSVLARRLSDNPEVTVLVIEAGLSEEVESVRNPVLWPENLESPHDWQFLTEPNDGLDGRKIVSSMGKVLGGGSSINALQWARGYRADWDHVAEVTHDSGWGYEAISKLYEAIECRPGQDPPKDQPHVQLEPANPQKADVPLLVEAAASIGMPVFENQNGAMLEGVGGAATMETIVCNGRRQSIYRSFLHPVRERPNLTIATETLVTRVLIEQHRATGVELRNAEGLERVFATQEVILCLGAVNTPKLLMQSGIGPADDLGRFGIAVHQDLPGVGQGFQDHLLLLGCAWRFQRDIVTPNSSRAVLQWGAQNADSARTIQINQTNGGTIKREMADLGLRPEQYWSLAPAVIQPKSRGRISLSGADPDSPIRIFSNFLAEAEDLDSAVDAIELCRELAACSAFKDNIGQELLPGVFRKNEVREFVRQRIGSFWHQSCTAKMGSGEDSVVNGKLQVHGISALRVADASVLPRIPAANTMAPCTVVGEKASLLIRGA